jgi:hypothetical protein
VAGFPGGPARANASTVYISTNGNTTDISAATLSLSTDVTAVNDAPTGSVTISGTAKQGEVLIAAKRSLMPLSLVRLVISGTGLELRLLVLHPLITPFHSSMLVQSLR